MHGRRAVAVHWKAERNSSVFKRVLNAPIEAVSRVDELRLFQIVGAAKQKLRLAAADFRNAIRRKENYQSVSYNFVNATLVTRLLTPIRLRSLIYQQQAANSTLLQSYVLYTTRAELQIAVRFIS